MEKERKLYKITVDDETLKFPIFAERVYHEPAKDRYGHDSSAFKELLTGIILYRGYTHPLLNRIGAVKPYLYPYTHPNKVFEQTRAWINQEEGLYFDEYSDISEVTEVSPKEVRDYYMSLLPGRTIKQSLQQYVQMFDEALSNQQKQVEKKFKENFECERVSYLYTTLHEDEQMDPSTLINKLVNR